MTLAELLNQKSMLKKTVFLLKSRGATEQLSRLENELESIEYQIRASQECFITQLNQA